MARLLSPLGGGPRVVVSTAAFHARGSVAGLGGFKGTKLFLPHPRVKVSIMGSLCKEMNSLLILLFCINYSINIISLNFLLFAIT